MNRVQLHLGGLHSFSSQIIFNMNDKKNFNYVSIYDYGVLMFVNCFTGSYRVRLYLDNMFNDQ